MARKHTVGRVVVISAVVLALVTGLSVVYFVRHLNGNIEGISLGALDEDERPEELYKGNGEPLDILVMGSDSRDCEGCDIDEEGGGGSDTTILVHLSADRSRAYAVSIPRDSIVDRPEDGCDAPAATDVMWNAAYGVGGPTCTCASSRRTPGSGSSTSSSSTSAASARWSTRSTASTCASRRTSSTGRTQIFVPKGDPSLLTGDEALDYVRARYVGEQIQQNDISRIRRQQEFIGALVREVKSAGTLTRLDKVVRFLNAATSA